jgi:hypothetical protein
MKNISINNVLNFNHKNNTGIIHFENLLNQRTTLTIKVLLKDKENAITFYQEQGYCMLNDDDDIDDELGEVTFITFQIDYKVYE